MKKLVYIHQFFRFPDSRGGTRSYDLSKQFIKQGYEVVVLTSTNISSNGGWKYYKRDGISVYEIYIPYDNSFNKFQRVASFVKFLIKTTIKLLSIKSDIVLATSTPLTIGIPALINKWFKKTPFIFEVRDVWPEAVIAIGAIRNKLVKNVLYSLEKIIYKNAHTIVPLSTDMQKSIVSRFPEFKNKSNVVIENIAEVNRFQSNVQPISIEKILGFQPRFSVLYAGTFGKVNGLHKFIELAEKTILLDDKVVYILLGEGAEKQNVIKFAKDKNLLNRNVFILNSITKNELPSWYKSVSMGASFVIDIPELWANSANKFFDTLASAKPILINHEGWQAETIRTKSVGYILPYEITEVEANRFVDYTKNFNLISQQELNALELAKEKYSLEVASNKYIKLLKK